MRIPPLQLRIPLDLKSIWLAEKQPGREQQEREEQTGKITQAWVGSD